MNNKYINKEMKTAITASWKSDSCCLFEIQSKNRQSLTTTFSDKSKTSEAKFNEKLYQTAKIWKTKLQTEQKRRINGTQKQECSTYSTVIRGVPKVRSSTL